MAKEMDVYKKFYVELTKVLPMIVNNLVTKLYSSKLLSDHHKSRIDSLPTDEEKTTYFLDKVIKPSIQIECAKLFDEMLTVMKNSDDYTVNYLVDEIQKFVSSSTSSTDQKPAATSKGECYGVVALCVTKITMVRYVHHFNLNFKHTEYV